MRNITLVDVILAALVLLIVVLIPNLHSLLSQLKEYYAEKVSLMRMQDLRMEVRNEITNEKKRIENFQMKAEASKQLIDIIFNSVNMEVGFLLRSNVYLNTKYELVKLDEDIATISQKVYEGLDPTIFDASMTNPFAMLTKIIQDRKDNNKEVTPTTEPVFTNTCYTSDYIMKMIGNITLTVLLDAAMQHNNDINMMPQ